MAPSSGPYGTTAVVYDPAGAPANPIADGWTTDVTGSGHSNFQRASNLIATTTSAAGNCQAYRGGTTYAIGSELWCRMPGKGANGTYADLTLAISDPNLSTRDLYQVELTAVSGTDTWDFYRQFNAVGAGPLASGTQEFTAGDYWAFCWLASGSDVLLEAYYAAAASSSWTKIINYTDTSASKVTVAGFMGIEATRGSAWTYDVIYGGLIPSSSRVPRSGALDMINAGVF